MRANIPALCVCGHVDGVVKGYQVLKTEDLPGWPGAAFDANAVLDNAHALLSFLHAHCTRPGGSYWVLKEPGANLVRVFDLHELSIAAATHNPHEANPFSRAVGLMCFRMAQRESYSDPACSSSELQQRRELLLQCVERLKVSEQPLLCSLAHAQLAQASAPGLPRPPMTSHHLPRSHPISSRPLPRRTISSAPTETPRHSSTPRAARPPPSLTTRTTPLRSRPLPRKRRRRPPPPPRARRRAAAH